MHMARQEKSSSDPLVATAKLKLMDWRRELIEIEGQLARLLKESDEMSVETKMRAREINERKAQLANIEDKRDQLLETLMSADEILKPDLSAELNSMNEVLSCEQSKFEHDLNGLNFIRERFEDTKARIVHFTGIKQELSDKFICELNEAFDSSGISIGNVNKADLDLLGHIRLDCKKCGQSFTTILDRFLDSPECPVCQKTSTPHGQRVQMNIRLLPEFSEMLAELVEHWKAQGDFEYHGLKAKEEDIKSPITFSRFLLQSSIRSLHANLLNNRRILELSQALRSFSFPDLPDDDDDDLEELKAQCRSWAIESWGIYEVQTMFESFWPHALQDARLQIKGPNTAEEEELLFRKMQLDLNSRSN